MYVAGTGIQAGFTLHACTSGLDEHKGFRGTVVNRALTSLHGWSLEITVTVLFYNHEIIN